MARSPTVELTVTTPRADFSRASRSAAVNAHHTVDASFLRDLRDIARPCHDPIVVRVHLEDQTIVARRVLGKR